MDLRIVTRKLLRILSFYPTNLVFRRVGAICQELRQTSFVVRAEKSFFGQNSKIPCLHFFQTSHTTFYTSKLPKNH